MNRCIKDNVVDNMLATAPAPETLGNILGLAMSLVAVVVGALVCEVMVHLGWKALAFILTF